jgi:hypothetical protein
LAFREGEEGTREEGKEPMAARLSFQGYLELELEVGSEPGPDSKTTQPRETKNLTGLRIRILNLSTNFPVTVSHGNFMHLFSQNG